MENSRHPNSNRDIRQSYRIAYLMAGFLTHNLTQEEKQELDRWILSSDENMILFEKMTDEKNLAEATAWFKRMKVEEDLQQTKNKIFNRKTRRARQYTVAASVAIIIAAGIYVYMSTRNTKTKPPLATSTHDLLPGSGKASLTLANGQVILLDRIKSDSVIESGIKVRQSTGEIVYDSKPTLTPMSFNTLIIPRKGHYKLMLSDGTIVWLNSESSIRFPVAFAGNERKVNVTGETFFEVAKDRSKPFRVVSGDVTIEALGTQFNVNAYGNEPFLSTTLVQGSILITKGSKENVLKPGQEARLTGENFQIANADIDEVVAWKNNQFKFTKTPIDAIMRQVERWYDADVEFRDSMSLHLNATIDRNVPVSNLLHIFEETNQVRFKVEGRKIIVMK